MSVIVGYSALAAIIAPPAQEMDELPSCGVMAVYTVAHHYQKDPSLAQVESLLGVRTGGDGGAGGLQGSGTWPAHAPSAPPCLDGVTSPGTR